jgi:hypothetical protein
MLGGDALFRMITASIAGWLIDRGRKTVIPAISCH